MAGIYIHVPFCKTKCIYCDFFTQTNLAPKAEYVSALCAEIALRKNYLDNESIHTIYFGGGTPSLLSEEEFNHIFDAIYTYFNVDADAEITLEANPDDLDDGYLKSLKQLPFNRLSIGIQSFNEEELLFLKRRHSAQKAKEAVIRSKEAGYRNISIDLMYGLPNQTMDIWSKNIHEAIVLDVQHISAYHLIYEEKTKLYRLLQKGGVTPIHEELSVDMFSVMIEKLTAAGFVHYEISSFGKEGLCSRHNSSYWKGIKYLGLGPAAHSFDGNNRAWNVASIPRYTGGIAKSMPLIEIEILDNNTQYNDFILTGMRTMWGINLDVLEKRFGTSLKEYSLKNAQKYINQGFVTNKNNILQLTSTGIFISDGIMSDMMYINN